MICQKQASLQTLDPLPNQHVNIKQESFPRASKNLQNPRHFCFVFILSHFLFSSSTFRNNQNSLQVGITSNKRLIIILSHKLEL